MNSRLTIVDVKIGYELLKNEYLQNRDRYFIEICVLSPFYNNYWTSDIKKLARGFGIRRQTFINRLKNYNVDNNYNFYSKEEAEKFIDRYITPAIIANKFLQ